MDCLDLVQGLYSFVACFRGTRFARWSYVYSMRKSKKKLHYFPLTVISKCRKWHLRGTDHEHGYAGPKTAIFRWQELAFLKFNLKFNSVALWIIQLQTHQAPGVGHFLLFPAPHGGGFVAFFALLILIPTYIPGWGGSGFTLTGALSTGQIQRLCCQPFLTRSWPCLKV